jgi:hypothetical protein
VGKKFVEKMSAAWGKLSPAVQSQVRHAAVTFVTVFFVTAKAALPQVTGTHSLKDMAALGIAAISAALAAGLRSALPLLAKAARKAVGL